MIPEPCIRMAHSWKLTFKMKIIVFGECDYGYISASTFSLLFSNFKKGKNEAEKNASEKGRGMAQRLHGPSTLLDLAGGRAHHPPSV